MSELATINIKGKDYVTVDTRLAEFRRVHPEWSIETNILNFTADSVTMQCVIRNEKERVIGTGIAHEERDDKTQMCNKTSYYEVCETSAIGRAICISTSIGNIGSIASADEVKNAIEKQEKSKATAGINTTSTNNSLNIVLNSGKYKGEHILDVTEKDRQYVEWMAGNCNDRFKKSAQWALNQCPYDVSLKEEQELRQIECMSQHDGYGDR